MTDCLLGVQSRERLAASAILLIMPARRKICPLSSMDRVPDFESVGCAFESHRGYSKSKGIAWALSNPLGNLERKSHAMTHLVTW